MSAGMMWAHVHDELIRLESVLIHNLLNIDAQAH